MTVKQQQAIIAHIRKHHTRYSQGHTMSYRYFRRIAGFIVKGLNQADPTSTRDTYKYLRAQAAINKFLMPVGLKLTSSEYYTKWHVALDTPAEVASMNNHATVLRQAASILRTGYAIYRGNVLAV